MHSVIIGAGISGLLSAYYLRKQGHSVEILEGAPHVASPASGANAAQLSYTYVNPIASPSLLKMLPKILMGFNKGFKVYQYDIPMVLWGLKLLRQTSARAFEKNRSELLSLSLKSRELFDALREDTAIEFKNHSTGKLQLFHEASLAASAREFAENLKAFNIEQKWLDGGEVEGFLKGFALDETYDGAIYSPIDETADCIAFCNDLLECLKRDEGFAIHYESALHSWQHEGGNIKAVTTVKGERFEADKFLLCTGSLTNNVTKEIGLKFPIYPIKGYTLVYPAQTELNCSVTDHKNKVVFVPQENVLMVSGMFHFDGHSTKVREDVVQHIHACAAQRIPALSDVAYEVRCGLRPCTPSSVPITEQTKYKNLYINSGQGMYGWTLSTASAQNITQLMTS